MTGLAHTPALLSEAIAALAPVAGGHYVDGTFGGGGYTRALLEAAHCSVWAIDRDPAAIERGTALASQYPGRLTVIPGRFGDMDLLLHARGVTQVDGVVFDLGTSSLQIDDPARGFSFRTDGPLDMRMEQSGADAAAAVNKLSEAELAHILRAYGEERRARRIAAAIVQRRRAQPFSRTLEIAELVRRIVPRAGDEIDPATRTFQALRIFVNDELAELVRGLAAAEALLAEGGRLVVVSFHSLEDRIVKRFLRRRSERAPGPSRHQPRNQARPPSFLLDQARAIRPTDAEIRGNPRARSARLRVAARTHAPAWGRGEDESAP
jgi:16S rRNA (cytosine1402-N4)-methyltransferase